MNNDNKHIDQVIKDKAAEKHYDFKHEYWTEMESVLDNDSGKIKTPFLKSNLIKYFSLSILLIIVGVTTALILFDKKEFNNKKTALNTPTKNNLITHNKISVNRTEIQPIDESEIKEAQNSKANTHQSVNSNENLNSNPNQSPTPKSTNQLIPIKNTIAEKTENKLEPTKMVFFPPKESNDTNKIEEEETLHQSKDKTNPDTTFTDNSNQQTSEETDDNNSNLNKPEEETPIERLLDFNDYVFRTANKFWENPSITGIDNQKVISISYENFNPRLKNDPNQFILSFDTKINQQFGIGTYLSYFNHDKNYTLVTANISMSYCLRFHADHRIVFGSGFNYVSNSFYGIAPANSFHNELWGDLKTNVNKKYFDLNTGFIYMFRNYYLISGISHAMNSANNSFAYNIASGASFGISRNLTLHSSLKFINDEERQIKNQFILLNLLSINKKYITGLEINFNDKYVAAPLGMKLNEFMTINVEPGFSLNNNVKFNYFMTRLNFHFNPKKEKATNRTIVTPSF